MRSLVAFLVAVAVLGAGCLSDEAAPKPPSVPASPAATASPSGGTGPPDVDPHPPASASPSPSLTPKTPQPLGDPGVVATWTHAGTGAAPGLVGLADEPCFEPGRQASVVEVAPWDVQAAVAATAGVLNVTVRGPVAEGSEDVWQSEDGRATARSVGTAALQWRLDDGPVAGGVPGLQAQVDALLDALQVPDWVGYRAELKAQAWAMPGHAGSPYHHVERWLEVVQTLGGEPVGPVLLRIDLSDEDRWLGLVIYPPLLVAGQVPLVEPDAFADAAEALLRCLDPAWQRQGEWRTRLLGYGGLAWESEAWGGGCRNASVRMDAVTGHFVRASVSCMYP